VAARVSRRHAAAIVVASTMVIVAAGCGIGASRSPRVTAPVLTPGPAATMSAAMARARGALVQALGTVNLILDEPQIPYRPAEAPELAGVPRSVFQAVLPDDPAHGYIVVYELPTVPEAIAAAERQATFVASGPGRVQYPPDTQFLIRRLDTTVVFHAYSRENSADRRAADVLVALRQLGSEVPIPR
jgi:hypothetical protein